MDLAIVDRQSIGHRDMLLVAGGAETSPPGVGG